MADDQSQPSPPEVDFAAAGLLDGLDAADARDARAQLLAELYDLGVGLDELAQAVAEGRLSLLPSERELSGELRYTARELAEHSGVDLEVVTAQRRASGLPTVDPDERAFGEEDLRAAGAVKRFLEAGLSPNGLLDSTRVFGQAGARSAAAVRTLLGQSLVRPGDTERDIALRFADAARELHADTILTLLTCSERTCSTSFAATSSTRLTSPQATSRPPTRSPSASSTSSASPASESAPAPRTSGASPSASEPWPLTSRSLLCVW